MNRTPKKIFFLALAFALSLGMIGVSWAMSQENEALVFESGDLPLLEVKAQKKDSAGFSNWERDLLERQSATITRTNYTDESAKQLLTEYIKAKQNNTKVNEDALIASILESNSSEKIQEEIKFTEYKISDLKISSDNSAKSLKKYGNDLGKVSVDNIKDPSLGSELEILTNAASLDKESELIKLNPIVSYYKNLISELLNVRVPSELSEKHLEIINLFSKILSSVDNLKNFLNDPVRGIYTLSNYANYTIELKDALKKIDIYLKSKEIYFDETEYGYIIEKAVNTDLENL